MQLGIIDNSPAAQKVGKPLSKPTKGQLKQKLKNSRKLEEAEALLAWSEV